ncbi:hypothetical protein BJ980_001846 [Nocardioides daedukensis]|uniref:SAM-dependent methyltransferase n=1 Tax=Nocardioides daedukensis TaxID=634462 RepID=A0A7Y9S2J8_9ACTN|nr:SAM-dependent methyltransferase [Nocardioides daedukensis]NYG58923.1 hypothetical protein [Nocardioides daedukensis]
MGSTSLGMPALPPRTAQPTWKQAWDSALYGQSGYLRHHPVSLIRDRDELVDFLVPRLSGHEHAVLLGAAGVLAPQLSNLLPGVSLRPDVPTGFTGIVVAVDWLSHVPAHVVQADDDDRARVVHVDPISGQESLGLVLDDPGVPPTLKEWLDRHWPLAGDFARAEVGTTREAAWRDVLRCLASGEAIAIEHNHLASARPLTGTLRAAGGPTIPDGTRDLFADVALDALADACEATLFVEDGPARIESRK